MVLKSEEDSSQVEQQYHGSDELPLTAKNLSKMEEGDIEHQQQQHSQDNTNGTGGGSTVAVDNRRQKRKLSSTKLAKILVISVVILLLLLLAAYLLYAFVINSGEEDSSKQEISGSAIPGPIGEKDAIPNPQVAQGPSASTLHMFADGAICSDSDVCSNVGRDIFYRAGNVVDAALATLFCNGITTLQSLGIGGGFIMNLYMKSVKKAYTIDAREVAPLKATENMFDNLPKEASLKGPLSIAVPGEIAGYGEAHKRFGTMPWNEIIEPSIKICENGFKLTRHMHDALNINSMVKNDMHLRKTFVNNKTNEFHPVGTHVFPPKELCKTYHMLAANGSESFYEGELADLIAEDLKDIGSIIVPDDLRIYHIDSVHSVSVPLGNDTMYVVPPVGSGVVLSHMLNILRGYNFSKDSISNESTSTLTYHRMAEAFKYAFAKRYDLGDMRFNHDLGYLVSNLTSNNHGDEIRLLIDDNKTFDDPKHYGAEFWAKSDNGTSHLSLLAPNGDAIAVTSTINYYFGCGHSGKRTGIIFNSGMEDFSKPGTENYFGLPSSKPNLIKPRKRAMSSMSPTIITNESGEVKLVIGSAGGAKIPTAIAQVIARVLWFGQDIKQALDAPRIHHQLIPNLISYEYGVLQGIIDGLEERGHKTSRYRERGSTMCGIFKNGTAIYANADYRKEGGAAGF